MRTNGSRDEKGKSAALYWNGGLVRFRKRDSRKSKLSALLVAIVMGDGAVPGTSADSRAACCCSSCVKTRSTATDKYSGDKATGLGSSSRSRKAAFKSRLLSRSMVHAVSASWSRFRSRVCCSCTMDTTEASVATLSVDHVGKSSGSSLLESFAHAFPKAVHVGTEEGKNLGATGTAPNTMPHSPSCVALAKASTCAAKSGSLGSNMRVRVASAVMFARKAGKSATQAVLRVELSMSSSSVLVRSSDAASSDSQKESGAQV